MLSDKKIKDLTKPGRYRDEQTLYLVVSPRGSRSWVQRLRVFGRRREMGLGGWPVVSLEEARVKALENRRTAYRGDDPSLKTRARTTPTFREAAEQFYQENLPVWKSGRAADEWLVLLQKYVFKRIGHVPVDKLSREHLLSVLKPIWWTKRESARKVRGRINLIIKWAMGHGFTTENVVDQIDGALSRKTSSPKHFRAAPYKSFPTLIWPSLCLPPADAVGRLCIRFLLLTIVRTQEARLATWDEIDWETSTWCIPAHRVKTDTPHMVPLSFQALGTLEVAKTFGSKRYIFPSPLNVNSPLGAATPGKVLVDCGIHDKTTVHGFRSAFRTWGSEATTASFDLLEMCLGHKVGLPVSQAYNQTDLLAKRGPIMQAWANYITSRKGLKVRTVTKSENS